MSRITSGALIVALLVILIFVSLSQPDLRCNGNVGSSVEVLWSLVREKIVMSTT